MNRVGLNRAWVAGLFALSWLLLFSYGAFMLTSTAPGTLFPRLHQPPPLPHTRGRILAADGTPLAISPRPGTRIYPLGALAGQVIGYTERAHGRYGKGLSGVERLANLALARGEDIRLTLDPKIQAMAEAALIRGVRSARARWGSLLVMARDGRLLAVANTPLFDPASPRGRPGEDPRLTNYAFRYRIEPGSTVKALTAATLLQAGVVRPDERIPVPYRRKVADRWVRDWHWHREERWSLEDILAYSSNVGISTLAERIPRSTLYRTFERLHLADPRLLPGFSVAPIFAPLNRWGPVKYANATFGQGFAITPLHLTAAMNALIDGRFHRPRLLAGSEGMAIQVFRPEIARQVRAMLTRRLARRARVPGYRLAGKTGTAQIAVPGGYDPERVVALFAGFIPGDKPRATAVVILYDPQVPTEERFGSVLAAPVFRELALELLSYWGIPPRGTLE